ncbi:MAG: ribosome maturation factor RimM [Bacilli bacterium]
MNLIHIGTIVNTHGIKGEVRIISDFRYKNQVFKKGNFLYAGIDKDHLEINSYRVHKNYDMITFKGINDINEVLMYKGDDVFIDRDVYKFDGILYEDIIGLKVIVDGVNIGVVESLMKSSAHPILVINTGDKKHLVPYIDEFVKNVDLEKLEITIKVIDGLIDEN